MNQSDLVKRVQKDCNLTKRDAEAAVETTLAAWKEALKNQEDVRFNGFGKFTWKTRKARIGRNPLTGEPVNIPEKRVLKFTLSPSL